MAALSMESLFHNKSSFQIAIRAIEFLLLSTGSVSTFLVFKGAVSPYLYDLMLSTLRKPLCYFRSWMSSPLYICITMNFIVFLIAISSLFHHQRMDNNGDIKDDGGSEDYDLHSSALSLSLSPPPPMQNNHQKQVQYSQEPEPEPEPELKDIVVVETSLKSHKYTNQDSNDVDKVDIVSLQGVFSDFSRLTDAKEIKKGPTTKVGGKIKTATASLKIQQDTHDNTNVIDESLQVVFSDYPKLTEAKEIKKACSLDSASQVLPIQKTTKMMTTKNGQKTINGKQNQLQRTKQQLENEDDEEDDTMEATWRAITREGAEPQKKQLNKSDTWPQSQSVVAAQEKNNDLEEDMSSSAAASMELSCLSKSMTFNDTVSKRCRGGLTRDPSMNLEEFNQRVEAFIKNFNNDLRLQRQESEQRYLDMINSGL